MFNDADAETLTDIRVSAHGPLLILTVAERAQRAATSENTCKLRKHFRQFDNAHAANAHNTTKKKETRCK